MSATDNDDGDDHYENDDDDGKSSASSETLFSSPPELRGKSAHPRWPDTCGTAAAAPWEIREQTAMKIFKNPLNSH